MSKVWWDWYCALFKQVKKSESVDPYTWRCHCGYTWKFNRLEL